MLCRPELSRNIVITSNTQTNLGTYMDTLRHKYMGKTPTNSNVQANKYLN